ncbi:MAG: PepSY-like domain-containing protein [Tannerellaceae bacterium]|jgi:hypothetical protein|nr:PepSY-like domain-containing protein [Tannerellaceae bacterium]
MFKQTCLGLFVICMALFSASCGDSHDSLDNKKPTSPETIPHEQVIRSFENKYGNVQNIDWNIYENRYYVAEFTINTRPAIAWFSKEGKWILGKTETSAHEIEPVISKAFSSSGYADWNIENRHILERRGLSTVYMLEVSNDNKKTNLYFTKYGDFIKVMDNVGTYTDMPVTIPEEINRKISLLFNDPEITDITWHNEIINEISVGVLENASYKVAALDSKYEWLSTFWELDKNTVPEVVWDAFLQTKYAAYKLTSIKAREGVNKMSFIFYVESDSKKEYILSFDPNGVLHAIVSYRLEQSLRIR